MTDVRLLTGLLALRETWCRPDEAILWCCRVGTLRFEVPGLRADGTSKQEPKRRKTGAMVLTVLELATSEGYGTSSGSQPPPDLIVSGPGPDCAAVRLAYAAREPGHWVLTSQRLAYVGPVPRPAPEPEPEPRTLLGSLRARAEGLRASITGPPPFVPGEPIPAEEQRAILELPVGRFTAAGVSERKLRWHTEPRPAYEKVLLPDASALEFYAGPGKGRLPRTRQTAHLLPIS